MLGAAARADTTRAVIDRGCFEGVAFDLDGVITKTAAVHESAWKRVLDDFLERNAKRLDGFFTPFTSDNYRAHVDGRPREEGIKAFHASRNLAVPEGAPDDGADADTVRGLGLQRHVNAAITFNVWQYFTATGDADFLYDYGAELMLEIARFWVTIAQWNAERGRFEIRGVMGPDEFHDAYPGADQPGINNNAYTNVMAAWCVERALLLFNVLPARRCQELCEMLGVDHHALPHWEDVSRKMHLPFHADGVISQFEGYENLEEFDWKLYRDKYGNIRRLDLILEAEGNSPNHYKLSKQADVLMLFYLSEVFTSAPWPGPWTSCGAVTQAWS